LVGRGELGLGALSILSICPISIPNLALADADPPPREGAGRVIS